MAFDAKQTQRARAVVVIVALAAVLGLAAVVLSGALTPKAPAPSPSPAASQKGGAQGAASPEQEHSMKDVDMQYGTMVKQLKSQHDANPQDPSSLLNLANGYFDWGMAAMGHAKTDDDRAHTAELFQDAVGAYDAYLDAAPGSKTAFVDRSICIFYGGDHARAISELEGFVKKDDTFGPAWANLGMFYEAELRVDDARRAYEKAVETDHDDAFQVKTFAEQHLSQLASSPGAGASK